MSLAYINLYYSYLDAFETLGDAEVGRLCRGALKYALTREAPDFRGNEKIIWPIMREQINRDQKAYEQKSQIQRENVMKRWKNTTVYDGIPTDTNYTDCTKEKEKEKEKEKDIYIKHKHGEYENVLLTDKELEKLQLEYTDWAERIERLSAYIASKGAKYKSHYATIRNWARKEGSEVKPQSQYRSMTELEYD